jgi:hypothetical protein
VLDAEQSQPQLLRAVRRSKLFINPGEEVSLANRKRETSFEYEAPMQSFGLPLPLPLPLQQLQVLWLDQ